MSLAYRNHSTTVLIGSKNSAGTRTPVALQTSYHANLTKSITTGGYSKATLYINYTTGAAETNNSIEVRIRTSPDGTNLYQWVNESATGGTSALTVREFTYVGASAATAYPICLPLDIADEYMEVAVKESGVAANAGTAFVELTLSGA